MSTYETTYVDPAGGMIATDVDPRKHRQASRRGSRLRQEAVMGVAIPRQYPAVVLRSQFNQLRALLAVALIAVAGLTVAVVVLANDNDQATSTSSAKPIEAINYGGSKYLNPSIGGDSKYLDPSIGGDSKYLDPSTGGDSKYLNPPAQP